MDVQSHSLGTLLLRLSCHELRRGCIVCVDAPAMACSAKSLNMHSLLSLLVDLGMARRFSCVYMLCSLLEYSIGGLSTLPYFVVCVAVWFL